MIVLDASAAVELLLNSRTGKRLAERLAPTRHTLHAPHLIDLEVAQALRRYVLQGQLAEERAARALRHLGQLDVTRYPHQPLTERVWALRANHTAYDAAYVSLAEALGATLLTCDSALARAAGERVKVELIQEDSGGPKAGKGPSNTP